MTWSEELSQFLKEAQGDLGIFVLLASIRKTENGGPGREMGVMLEWAHTFERQVRAAANTIRHREVQAKLDDMQTRDPRTGLFGLNFLSFFSSIYAPINAENDPNGLNKNHLPNLTKFHASFTRKLLAQMENLSA